jgi:hypothetical protein
MFDLEKFRAAKLRPRTADVAVPGLKAWFDDGVEAPAWTVRGLTGQELGQARAAVAARKDLAALVDGILGGAGAEKADAVRKLFDLGEEVPPDVALRIHLLRLGSVAPACTEDDAVRVCTCFPIEFAQLTQKILELTGAGHEPGKAGASGETRASEAP